MTYGHLSLASGGSSWVVGDLAPHVAIRFKRVFPKARPSAGEIRISASGETSDELRWFIERYPLSVDDKTLTALHARADAHVHKQQLVLDLLSARAQPGPAVGMAEPGRLYQCVAAELAYTTGRLLVGDEVGLGKTVTAIVLLAREGRLPAVVVCPTHLPHQVWKRSLERFLPGGSVHVAETTDPKRERKGSNLNADVLVIPYSRLHGWSEFVEPRTVVFDEVHELRRNSTRKYEAASIVARKASCRMGLSATPIFNYGGEFHPVMEILAPGELGTWEEFAREWCSDGDGRHATIRNPEAFGVWLRESGLMIRRSRRDVGRELPPLVRTVIDVEASSVTADQSQMMVGLAERVLAGHRKDSFLAAGELDAMARKITGLAKAPAVAGLVRHLVETAGEPVLLYGWHHEVYAVYEKLLGDLAPAFYTGRQGAKAKDAALERFLSGQTNILIMSLRSGQGVDGLQGVCHRVVYGELDWSPAVLEQSTGRAYRDGQQESTMVYFPICDFGSDPIMLDVLDLKRGQSDPVIDPKGERVLATQVDPEHVKRLAREILGRQQVVV